VVGDCGAIVGLLSSWDATSSGRRWWEWQDNCGSSYSLVLSWGRGEEESE